MGKKLKSVLLTLFVFVGGGLTTRLYDRVKAESWAGLVGSVNGTSPDADGNVNVAVVNNKTVNSNVPATADFAQYDTNTSDIAEIQTALNGLTAMPENVVEGYTFIGDGGTVSTGTLNTSSGTVSDLNFITPGSNEAIHVDEGTVVKCMIINFRTGSYKGNTTYSGSTLYGSNDGTNWTQLDSYTRSAPAWNAMSATPYSFGLYTEYTYYKQVTSNWVANESGAGTGCDPCFVYAVMS